VEDASGEDAEAAEGGGEGDLGGEGSGLVEEDDDGAAKDGTSATEQTENFESSD